MLKPDMAGRRRAAVELIAREGAELRGTAARISLCADDAEDAYQRALEILLLKAPTDNPRDLLRWTKTVIKHEALAVRANRERLLGRTGPWAEDEDGGDRAAREPSHEDSPEERCERDEELGRKREVLRSLKPAEQRSLTLLAAGYSYAEIAERTGYSERKVNRSLAEGRERFRALIASSEDGSRCREMRGLLSAYCDGEAAPERARAVREHLRACAGCRVAMRAYRSAPATVAALAPALPASRSLLERAQELVVAAQARLPGGGSAAEAGAAQTLAAGGTRGGGMAVLAKALTICAGTAGAGAACVAGGVAPPLGLVPDGGGQPAAVRQAEASASAAPTTVDYEPAPEPEPPSPAPAAEPEPEPAPAPQPATESAPATEAGAVEYAPPPEPAPTPAASSSGAGSSASSGSAAGEFGP
jgi:RNA polymerase sigma factor (sigma-70 family)